MSESLRGDRWLTVNTMFLFLGKEKWIGYCERVFFLCQEGWRVSKCFLLRMRKPRITLFFAFLKLKREREYWKGYTQTKTENNWSTINYACVLFLWKFIYSKRSTGFWYCEKFQGPGKTSGTKNCDQNLFSFLLFQIFSKVYQFRKGLVELLLWEIQRSFLFFLNKK